MEDPFWSLLLLLGISLSVKTVLLCLASSDAINTDGVLYIEGAKALALGQFQTAIEIYPMPLLPGLIALFHGIIKNWCLAARMVSLTFASLTLVPLYFITRDLFEKRSAFWACLAFGLHPFGNQMAYLVYRGPLYLFFLACTIWTLIRYLKEPTCKGLLASFAFSMLAASVRIEGLLMLFIIPIMVITLSFFHRKFRNNSLLIAIAWGTCSVAGIVISTQLMEPNLFTINRLGDVIETFKRIVSLKIFEQYLKIYHALEKMEVLSILPTENQNFGEIARHYLWLVYLIGLGETVIQALFPIYLIPAFIAFARERLRLLRTVILVLFFSYLALNYVHLISHDYTNKRFVWACSFMLFPWVGRGIEISWRSAQQFSRPLLFKGALVILFCFLPIFTTMKHFETVDGVVIRTGKWLKASKCKELTMLVNDKRIPFYAGIDFPWLGKEGSRTPYVFVNTKLEGISRLKRLASETKPEIVILKLPKKHASARPRLTGYDLIKIFNDKKRVVFIFAQKTAARLCAQGMQ